MEWHRSRFCLPQPMLCPEIHGESGLDGPHGEPFWAAAAPPAMQYARAVPRMFERISMHYAERCESASSQTYSAIDPARELCWHWPRFSLMEGMSKE